MNLTFNRIQTDPFMGRGLIKSLLFSIVGSLALQGASLKADDSCPCGGGFSKQPLLSPIIYPSPPLSQSNQSFDCFMWQTFIYLNWPALPASPGTPDKNGTFDGIAPVVWETYKDYKDVFLPNGATPPPWNQSAKALAAHKSKQADLNSGKLRLLTQTSKIHSKQLLASLPPFTDQDDKQVGEGVLIDQAGNNVYYEELMNEDEFNYVLKNKLYEANSQAEFAQNNCFNLPTGNSSYGPTGALELKAAWKVLTQAELSAQPIRFLTAQALINSSTTPVTVGLVGLHIIQRPENTDQGVWATFAQIDNCPLQSSTMPTTVSYSFYNPSCQSCAVNLQTTPPTPTQLVQVTDVGAEAKPINAWVQNLIASKVPNSPFQFYQLINVQWPQLVKPLISNGLTAPLSDGNPLINNLVNPVLESFLQSQTPRLGCLSCHVGAHVANQRNLASCYSFLFSPAKPAPAKSKK